MSVVSCLLCKKEFNKKPSQILLYKKHYCSNTCSYTARRMGKIVNCHICGLEVYKIRKALNSSKSGKYFCSKSCQAKWRNKEFIGSKHSNWKNGNSTYRNILSRHDVPMKCGLCNTEDKRVLAVHHVDRNHSNNKLDNLAWLCHNCHFLVHHDNVERQRFAGIHNSLR